MSKNDENENSPVWRESSSLIICAKSLEKLNEYDYRILIIKRSDRTAVFMNQGAFPGDIFDPFDESIEWLKYLYEFGVTHQLLKELVEIEHKTERPKILLSQGAGCYDRFFNCSKIWAREISLRINAIRETFEEVGVLLCRTQEQLHADGKEGFCQVEYDKAKWQKLVHADAKQFLAMCKELKVVPDLWGLHEWCCWASPANFIRGYETAFFVTFLNEVPNVMREETEVKECLWLPPSTFVQMVRESKIYFLPPQIYELLRFIPHKSFSYMKQFSWERRKKGIITYRAIAYACTDGFVFVLPGDDFYTGDPCQATLARTVDCSKAELRLRSQFQNRVENPGAPNVAIFCNIKLSNGHLTPVSDVENVVHKL